MPSQAELLALPIDFEFKGKVYKIANPITFEIEGAVCDWVYRTALNFLERQRALGQETQGRRGMTEEQYDRAFQQLQEKAFAGEFEWGSKTVVERITKTWAGIKMVLLLRMQKYDHTVTLKLIDEIFKDKEATRRLNAALNPPEQAGGESNTTTGPSPEEAPPADQ